MKRRARSLGAWPLKNTTNADRTLTLRYEPLELRAYLTASAVADVFGTPQIEVAPAASGLANPTWLTPAEVRAAYGFNQITFGNIQGTGAGQTIAIVDAYDDPNIASDLAAFDKQFGLTTANLTKVEMTSGGQKPATNADWDMEISLDVEWAHAIAPGANILLVEATNSSLSSLLSAVNYARDAAGVSVVSMSWGSSEFNGETSYDSDFTTPAGHAPVAFVASSGDGGAGAIWPSVSSNVLGVGGTTLTLTTSGAYGTETAWSGSGGGVSAYETEPSYQRVAQTTGHRTTPDVSYDANPSTGFIVYDSVPYNGSAGWWVVGGTSAGAPQWAGLIAIADQGLAAAKKADIGNAASAVYNLPSTDFHDVTSGSNGGYSAGKGYDLVTGLGTPIANKLVADLVTPPSSSSSSAAKPATTTTTTATSLRALLSSGSGMDLATNVDGIQQVAFTVASQTASTPGTPADLSQAAVPTSVPLAATVAASLADSRLATGLVALDTDLAAGLAAPNDAAAWTATAAGRNLAAPSAPAGYDLSGWRTAEFSLAAADGWAEHGAGSELAGRPTSAAAVDYCLAAGLLTSAALAADPTLHAAPATECDPALLVVAAVLAGSWQAARKPEANRRRIDA